MMMSEQKQPEFFDQRRVTLAKLTAGGGHDRPFRRLSHESQSAMRHRLYSGENARNFTRGKVAAYERAISFGAEFPPIFVFDVNGSLVLHDGWNRCAAATLRGHNQFSAVVFYVSTAGDSEALALLLFEQQALGAPWRDCVLSARALLRARRAAGETAT